MPDVRDKPAEEARRLLEEAGLEVDPVLREVASPDIARGHVIDQSPSAGAQVSKGTRVNLTVSSGPETRTVPDVTGQNLESARATLESAEFVVRVTEVDSTEPEGRVLEVPQAGERVATGSTIEIRVSRGNQMRMPNVEGRKVQDAERAIRDAGATGTITVRTVTTIDPTKVDTVQAQRPGPDAVVNKDGDIELEVFILGVSNPADDAPGIKLPLPLPGLPDN